MVNIPTYICYQCEKPAVVLSKNSRCIECVTENFEKTEADFVLALEGNHPFQLENKKEPEDIVLQAISAYGDGWYDGYIKAIKMRDEFDSQTADYALMASEDAEGKSHYGQENKASERLKHLEAKAGRAGFVAGFNVCRESEKQDEFRHKIDGRIAADQYAAEILSKGA